jgi:hypothetical protein
MGFYNGKPVFAIGFYNGANEPANIGLEEIHVSAGGSPLRVFSVQELEKQAKRKAWWTQFGLALAGAFSSAAAANRTDSYHGSIVGPYGSYGFYGSAPSLAGQLEANQIRTDTAYGMAAIRYRLDQTLEGIGNHVVQRTTVDPGSFYGGLIVLDKLNDAKPPFELRLSADWNGERYPFAFLIQKSGQPVPQEYAAMLAANAKPKLAVDRGYANSPAGPSSAVARLQQASAKAPEGAIMLRSGAVKVPAKTPSGYCLVAPDDYYSTGSRDYPMINAALPRCTDKSQ